MESPPSTSTTTPTTAKQDTMPSSQNTSVDKKPNASNANHTLPIPNPAHSPVFQKYVTDAAEIIASTCLTRNMFIVEVFKKCSEIALWEKRTGKTSPELLPKSPVPTREPLYTSNSYSSDVQHVTPVLYYPDVYQPCKPIILQQTRVPNSLPKGANYVDYEPQGTEVIQACLQTTP